MQNTNIHYVKEEIMEIIEVLGKEQRCFCGGVVKKLFITTQEPEIWRGECSCCGRPYIIVM